MAIAGSDARTYAVAIPSTTKFLRVTLSHPSLAVVGINGPFEYTVTVRDAAGQVVGVTTETLLQGAGTASVLIDLRTFANPPWSTAHSPSR